MSDRPNIVFIISDQHKRSAAGCYGNDVVKTPNIDWLAEHGTTFTQAYCNSPLCAPSRASCITGVEPHRSGSLYHFEILNGKNVDPGATRIPGYFPELKTFGDLYRENGYRTAAFGKVHVHGETPENDMGFDERAHRFYTYGYREYIDKVGLEKKNAYINSGRYENGGEYNLTNEAVPLLSDREMQDTYTTDSSIEFIARNRAVPFFLHVGLEKPHPPWSETGTWMGMYRPEDIPDSHLPATRDEMMKERDYVQTWQNIKASDREIKNSIASYYANISSMDDKVGQIIQCLRDNEILDNTVIIYVSDHGEMLFEHGIVQKHCMYEASAGVPLIFYFPRKFRSGVRTDHLASLIDLMPTLCDISGISKPVQCRGESLEGVLTGKTAGAADKAVFSEFVGAHYPGSPGTLHAQRMVIKDGWKYIFTSGLPDQLYRAGSDERIESNLSAEYPDKAAELKALVLKDWNTRGRLAKGRNIEDILGN
ncbi:MAG: sulfatase-like hydrolase/transferase [Spirochaetales bacterium]|nr:sulfatase-like hydrolase/transferase [Spirochaetales bacterium]